MRVTILLSALALGCIAPQPPGGQFVCADNGDCPDGFSCQEDAHCYDNDRVPECFIFGQQPGLSTGCPGTDGCYWGDSTFGPLCQQPGRIGQYGTGCDLIEINSPLERRCAPGHVCVPGDGVFTFDSTCLRICDIDATCTDTDLCSLRLPISERNNWWAGNEIRFCYPLDGL